MREHIVQEARIHYVIEEGGMQPNIVPDYARSWYFIRAPEREQVDHLYDWVLKIAEGAALMTQTELKVEDAYDMSSWNMSYMNIFLSEYYLLTRDEDVLPKLRQMALYLANGQSQVGTWGHGNVLPSGVLGGYGAMCNPSLSCAVSLQLDQKCGIDDPVVEKAIRKSEVFFSKSYKCTVGLLGSCGVSI